LIGADGVIVSDAEEKLDALVKRYTAMVQAIDQSVTVSDGCYPV